MTRRRRPISRSRHRQRQMLVLVQVILMVGILAFVVLFRDHFGLLTSSFVSNFGAEDVQVQQGEPKENPSPLEDPSVSPPPPEGQRLPPLK